MDNAKDLASQRATQETLKQPPPPQAAEGVPSSDGMRSHGEAEGIRLCASAPRTETLTSFEDMMADYKTGIVKTSSGKTFEIQCVSPGDLLILTGSPLLQTVVESGVDLSDEAEVEKAIEASGEAMVAFMELATKVVIRGITSLTFVDKRQDKCSGKELSIDRLSAADIIDTYTAIENLSASEGDVAEIQLFRQNGEGEQGEHNSDIPDSENIRETPNGDIVPGEKAES